MEIRFVSIAEFRTAFSAESNARQVMVHDIWDNLKEIPTAGTKTASAKEAADNNQVKNQKP